MVSIYLIISLLMIVFIASCVLYIEILFLINIFYQDYFYFMAGSDPLRSTACELWEGASDRKIHHIFAGERGWTSLIVRTSPGEQVRQHQSLARTFYI